MGGAPATLKSQAFEQGIRRGVFKGFSKCCPWFRHIVDERMAPDLVYGIDYTFFRFQIVCRTMDYSHFYDLIPEQVCEISNTWDALLMSEHEKIWFKFLDKILTYGFYGITIPITIHWYEYLYDTGLLFDFYKVETSADLTKLLLKLAGDVESNPGPTYKEVCSLNYKKKQHTRKIYTDKNMIRMNLHLKDKRTNKDFDYMLQEETRVQGEMQILGMLSSAVQLGVGAHTTYKANKFMSSMESNAQKLTSQITDTLMQFRQLFSRTEQYIMKGIDVISLIGDIILGLIQVSLSAASKRLYSLGIEVFRILSKHAVNVDLLGNIRDFTDSSFKYIKGRMQIDTQGVADLLTPTHICMFLMTILSFIFTGVAPKATSAETLLKRLGDVSRSTKNIIDFNNSIQTGMTFVMNEVKKQLGLRPSDEIEQFVVGIDKWFDEVRDLLSRVDEWKKSDQVLKDPATILEVENLYKRGLEYSRDISDKKLQRELTMPFNVHMKYLTELMKMVDTSGAFGTKPRTQPVVIWLYGESGVGKSGMSWPLAIDLNNIFVHNAKEAKEFSKHIYMRNVEQEFWDNYQGQNVVIYDDFGQRVDSQAQPNEEFMELIRTANIAPYPLHMAHLEDKRKTRFTSKILLLTSNVFEQNVSSLTFPDAFRRRIDLCGKVTNVTEFTKMGYSGKTGEQVRRLDKKKVQEHFGEVISTEVYNIDLVDPESGATLERNLTYEDFLERAAEKTRDAFDSSRKMNEFLEKYAENRFKIINDEDFRVQGSMQIDDEFTEASELVMQSGKSLDELIALASKGILVDKNAQPLTVENITTDKFDEYFGLNLSVDFDTWHIYNLRETCFVRLNNIYNKLVKIKDYAMSKLREWKNKFCTWVKEHPYTIACSLLGVLLSVLTISKFWNRYFRAPKECNKLAEVKHKNITIKVYKDQDGVDVREFNQAGILSIIPKVIKTTLFESTKALIMNKPYPLVLNVLAQLGVEAVIYSVSRIINMHGKKLELSETSEVMTSVVMEAKPSGDAITLKQNQRVLEAKASADPTTIKQHRVVVEARASGDPTTLAKTHKVLEANCSADPTTLRSKSRVLEGDFVPAEMQMWKDQTAQNLITNRIFSNLYKICKVLEGNDVQPLLHGLFVKGTCMLVPTHLCEFLDENDKVEIVNSFNTAFVVPWNEIKQIQVVNALGQEKEATLLVFPNYIPQHCDITKHFSNAESISQYKKADVCLPLLRYSDKLKHLIMYILGNTQAAASDKAVIIEDYEKGKDYIIREGLLYNLPTKNGDCGAPLIVNETQVLRKIAGIHVAGDVTGTSYAESITQRDLSRALSRVPATMQINLDLDKHVSLHSIELPINTEINPLDYKLVPSEKFNAIGRITPLFEPNQTELRKSLIYGQLAPITTKPAKLRNYVEDGKLINIKHKNLGKAAMDTPYLDPTLLDNAVHLVKQKWLKNIRPELRHILTYEESIKGNDLSEYISPINRRSSPGYPWIKDRPKGKPGKTGWFGEDEYILDETVEQAVKFRIDQARKGIRVPTMWVDTLKDERRPIAKVDAGKTRVFSNGPMDYSIAFRQYFLGFVAHLMENRITNEVSIGTNVYSRDWTKTARKMKEKGDKVFAGDFSTFDGTLNSSMMFRFLDVVNAFYNDGEENALIRYVLFSEIVNSVHICEDLVYYMTHSQPSGNPVTTPLNCFVNSVGGRMCFEIAAMHSGVNMTMYDFDKHVSLVSYGDDNIYNISDHVAEWFNMHTITSAFAEIGMIYTDETKDLTKTPPKYKTLEEVSYLKRGFINNGTGRWLAPLAMETILEMPNWCRGGLDIEEGTKVNCENAIMELAMHPVEVYNEWSNKINLAFMTTTGNSLDFKTYKQYHYDWLEEYFL
ncbi:putative non-structural polyprotein [Solenopsis invicta virus 12]|nr:putative non-structural polyprotein [Solenopsis invicta virus 12]